MHVISPYNLASETKYLHSRKKLFKESQFYTCRWRVGHRKKIHVHKDCVTNTFYYNNLNSSNILRSNFDTSCCKSSNFWTFLEQQSNRFDNSIDRISFFSDYYKTAADSERSGRTVLADILTVNFEKFCLVMTYEFSKFIMIIFQSKSLTLVLKKMNVSPQ